MNDELRYAWTGLNKQQVGAYCEYFVKMELTMHGFQVYTTEVDDRGIDFVCRYGRRPFLEIQVKAIRTKGNVFLLKDRFHLNESFFLALGLMFSDGKLPDLYLIPSLAWKTLGGPFGSNDYGEGFKSKPEWRLNVSNRHLDTLEKYRFSSVIANYFNDPIST